MARRDVVPLVFDVGVFHLRRLLKTPATFYGVWQVSRAVVSRDLPREKDLRFRTYQITHAGRSMAKKK